MFFVDLFAVGDLLISFKNYTIKRNKNIDTELKSI